MGNSPSYVIPDVIVHGKILSYVTVDDAKSLMQTCKTWYDEIVANRPFWLEKGRQLYKKDPSHFQRLRDPSFFDNLALVKHVCAANAEFIAIRAQIFSGRSAATECIIQPFGQQIQCISADPVSSLLVIAFANKIEIYSLLSFGDPPLRVIPTEVNEYRQIIIHGDFLYIRPPTDLSIFHFDVHDWENSMPLIAVPPRYALAKKRPMRMSDQFLVAFDGGADRILAYPITRDRFFPNPIQIAYDDGNAERCLLYDYNVNGAQLLVIVERDYVYFFCERYDAHTGQMLQRILVAFPAVFHEPRLAYPHILIA